MPGLRCTGTAVIGKLAQHLSSQCMVQYYGSFHINELTGLIQNQNFLPTPQKSHHTWYIFLGTQSLGVGTSMVSPSPDSSPESYGLAAGCPFEKAKKTHPPKQPPSKPAVHLATVSAIPWL